MKNAPHKKRREKSKNKQLKTYKYEGGYFLAIARKKDRRSTRSEEEIRRLIEGKTILLIVY